MRKRENTVRAPDLRICSLLLQLAGYFNKHYCHPSQDKICELVKKFFGRPISRRHLNRHLAALERDGYITRTRRHEYDKRRGLVLRSTLYRISGRYLAQMRHALIGVEKFRTSLEKSAASIRVPRAAQYAKSLLEMLVRRATYPQVGPPKPS